MTGTETKKRTAKETYEFRGGVDDETAVHACEAFREPEATEGGTRLAAPGFQLAKLFFCPKSDNSSSEEVVMHCCSDPKSRSEAGCVVRKQTVGEEKSFWIFAYVTDSPQPRSNQLPQTVGSLFV